MPIRFLYGVAGLLLVVAVWQAWGYHRIYQSMDYMSGYRAIGASPANAATTVDVYLDYMAPASKAAGPVAVQMAETMGGVRVVFHAVPLSPVSRKAAEIVYAAGLQDKFTEMHELMIRNDGALTDERIEAMASQAGVDFKKLMQDSNGSLVANMLDADVITRKSLNLAVIPAFILNRDILYSPSGQDDVQTDLMRNFVPIVNEARNK